MADETTRRLYTVTGIMQRDGRVDVLSGALLATSEDEARGNHVRWMLEQRPGYTVHSCNVFLVSDATILAAAKEIAEAPGSPQEVDRLRSALRQIAEPAPDAAALKAEPGAEYWCTVATRRQDMALDALRA